MAWLELFIKEITGLYDTRRQKEEMEEKSMLLY